MDGTRFDALTKVLAAGLSRRRVLGVLTGAAAAVVAAPAGAVSKRRRGEICRKDGECASGACGPRDATGRRRCLGATGDTCVADPDCGGGPCLEGACCSGLDYCEFGEICCDPNRSPTETCCPAGNGGCCECFERRDPGNEGIECCPPQALCKSLTNSPAGDRCLHNDEVCVNGAPCWEGRACEDRCCETKCCNGQCCASGEECVVASGDQAARCHQVRECTEDAQCSTSAGEVCATEDGVCCPPERTITFEITTSDGPMTLSICCSWGTLQSVWGGDLSCCSEPDRCGTTRGSFTRF